MKRLFTVLGVAALLSCLSCVCLLTIFYITGETGERDVDASPFAVPGVAYITGEDSDENEYIDGLLIEGHIRAMREPGGAVVVCTFPVRARVELTAVISNTDGRFFIATNSICEGWVSDEYLTIEPPP